MMHNINLVAKREYIKVVRKKSFWISTFLFPLLMIVLSFVSGYSSQEAERKVQEEAANVDSIVIIDQAGIIKETQYVGPFQKGTDVDSNIEKIKNGEIDALFIYPTDILSTGEIYVYAPDTGIVSRSRFNGPASEIARQSILAEISNQSKLARFQQGFTVQSTTYDQGEEVVFALQDLVVPIVSIIIYFLLIFLATNFLLMSVSEEKETRMIEIILSILTPKELIWGKIIGLTGVIFTQMAVLAASAVGIFHYATAQFPLPIDLSSVVIEPGQVIISLFYL
ncbi:ABC transporter permease, partial [candidate division WWE3 bacterium]|nr:ABC transporter permease [candidate division WWE3 bacterium]